MKDQKKDIPLVIIDTRKNATHTLKEEQHLPQQPFLTYMEEPKWATILSQLFQKVEMSIQKLKENLKNIHFGKAQNIFQNMRLPWLKIGLLILVSYILLKKDMRFNFALSAPLSVFTDDDDQHKDYSAQSIALTGETANPYAPVAASSLKADQTKKFIQKHTALARSEMNKYGIPASIKMAQALIESRAGTSLLASKHNNFFGMKCFSKKCVKGHCTNRTDDHHKDFFRNYAKYEDSWRDHSLLISQGRYEKLLKHKKDYKKWAFGLKEVGYATDKRYAQKLIDTIEKYKLYRLDS